MSGLQQIAIPLDFQQDFELIKGFLEKFTCLAETEEGGKAEEEKYLKAITRLVRRESSSLLVELDDLVAFGEVQLAENVRLHTKRYERLFYKAAVEVFEQLKSNLNMQSVGQDEPVDVLIQQRRRIVATNNADPDTDNLELPQKLLYRFDVLFKPVSTQKTLSVRQANGSHIGNLVTVKAMVTRITDVRPDLSVATYTCGVCGSEVFQEISSDQYSPLSECPSVECERNGVKGELTMQMRGCRFTRSQEAKLQELTEQVPMGHVPRSMTVQLHNDLTRQINAVFKGYRAMRMGLLTETYLVATHVKQMKQQYEAQAAQDDQAAVDQVNALANDAGAYERLSKSIAPEIYGHEDVKKALLLLIVSGETRVRDRLKVRGDINICLMGDPGVAKSQLIRWVARCVPRGVYTTGKGSSGVGLTAAVVKDPITGEIILEPGSLVLADNGVCCIDEFDKMEESDRTAIHEVMEQQTISISKAGINTTLNARTSILAAANPVYGRYNKNRSISENVNLPPALLSRFDLLFLILDESNSDSDSRLAEHILHVHRHGRQPELGFEPLEPNVIRQFIAQARAHSPVIPPQLEEFVVGAYVQKRNEAHEAQVAQNGDFIYTQPRTLLAILRMSQALARLRLSNEVEEDDIRETLRLMDAAKDSLRTDSGKRTMPKQRNLVYFSEIRKLQQERGSRQLDLDEIRDRLRVTGGYKEEDLMRTIEQYENLNVWARVGNSLAFI